MIEDKASGLIEPRIVASCATDTSAPVVDGFYIDQKGATWVARIATWDRTDSEHGYPETARHGGAAIEHIPEHLNLRYEGGSPHYRLDESIHQYLMEWCGRLVVYHREETGNPRLLFATEAYFRSNDAAGMRRFTHVERMTPKPE